MLDRRHVLMASWEIQVSLPDFLDFRLYIRSICVHSRERAEIYAMPLFRIMG